MERVFNFSAGPSVLPYCVLEKVQQEILNYSNSGMSVMEMSHRSVEFENIVARTEQLLRSLLHVPTNYRILFLQGGASTQFAMVPLNLLSNSKEAGYVNTGTWSKKAISEAKKYGKIHVIASSEDQNFSYIPAIDETTFPNNLDYLHITTNNTIEGTCFQSIPKTNIPLVADMSSNILSQPYDINDFGLIYAGAQKNLGPAGLTIVMIREDLLNQARLECPTMLNYTTHNQSNSMYNTPPTFSIYVAMLVLEWLTSLGGVEEIHKQNLQKANFIYDYLDQSQLFTSPVDKGSRSLMNIPFTTPDDELNKRFIKEAQSQGLVNLKGHRLVGGMRASIYNAMPTEGVIKLVDFMKVFENKVKEEYSQC